MNRSSMRIGNKLRPPALTIGPSLDNSLESSRMHRMSEQQVAEQQAEQQALTWLLRRGFPLRLQASHVSRPQTAHGRS